MIQPTNIHPITDFKRDTRTFVDRLKASGLPEVLTIEGRGELVVQDAAAYQRLVAAVDRAETISGIQQGLADVEAGRHVSLDEFEDAMRAKHSIPSDA
jgi:PHD/YefM family antitoxin component YafN of YafNO toxin-antitoxin module